MDAGSDLTFEALMHRLESIVESLESRALPLEESMELFEEGVRLTRQVSGRLEAAERRIEELLSDGRVVPLGPRTAEQPEHPTEDDPD